MKPCPRMNAAPCGTSISEMGKQLVATNAAERKLGIIEGLGIAEKILEKGWYEANDALQEIRAEIERRLK